MIAKTLSGDFVCLEAKSDEEFKSMYVNSFVKEPFRPFVRVNLFHIEEQLCMSVNTYCVLPDLEPSINWQMLSINPAAIHLLERNLDKVDWYFLCRNPTAIRLIEQNIDKIEWDALCYNPSKGAYELLRRQPDKIEWLAIAVNAPYAYELMNEFFPEGWRQDNYVIAFLQNKHCKPEWVRPLLPELLEKTDMTWGYICRHPNLIEIVKEYPEKIRWEFLSLNPAAIEILKQNPDKVRWESLVGNRNPEAIDMFVLFRKRIPWSELALNPAAIPFLSQHVDQLSSLCWNRLCAFPEAIELLTAHTHKIKDWYNLLLNEKAGDLIRANLKKFNKDELFIHPCVVCPPLEHD